MKAVILAANPSSRLSPFIETRAKPMIRVAGRYILENTLQSILASGIRDILMVVNHQQDSIRNHFGSGTDFGINLEYVEQESPKGIGNALLTCRNHLEDQPFILVYGDVLAMGNPFAPLLSTYSESGKDVGLVTLPASSSEFGNVYLDPDMIISRLVEKPGGDSQANYVFGGIFVLQPHIFPLLERYDQSMAAAYQHLIDHTGIQACLWEEGWIDIIYPWHILEANQMLMNDWNSAHIHSSARLLGSVHLQGAVVIEKGVTVESGSVLKGPCYLGQDCYIGNNVLIRGYSALGPGSVVGYGSELKNCVVFGKSDIGRLSFIGDSVLGENTFLGSGLTTVNHNPDFTQIECSLSSEVVQTGFTKLGAFIGDNVTIGTRHTLAPGCQVKAGRHLPNNITF